MAASSTSKPLQDALIQVIKEASVTTAAHVDPAVERLNASQDGLEAQLHRLDDEMACVTSILETLTLDPETSARMQETQECLKRTKKKLITIRGRLGRLRAYEESDRLRLTERSMDVFWEGTKGGNGEGDSGDVEGERNDISNADGDIGTMDVNRDGGVKQTQDVAKQPSVEGERSLAEGG